MNNRTVGEIEVLSWQHYSLGVFLVLTFISISVFNILVLKCFYNLRHQAFVRNSMAVISLVATDLVNAIILTPILFLWFFLPPPNNYTTCLIKSLPFMVSNYTSLLNMTSFCVHRFIVIRKLTVGRIKVHTPKYGAATLIIWSTAILCVSLPYIFWKNTQRIILDCRRAVFSDVKTALSVFSLLFDIPLISMNLVLFTLFILLKKYQAKVAIAHTSDSDQTENENFVGQTLRKISNSVHESSPERANSVKLATKNLDSEGKLFDDESSSVVSPDVFQIHVVPLRAEMVNHFKTTENEESNINDATTVLDAQAKAVHETQIKEIKKQEYGTNVTLNGMADRPHTGLQTNKTAEKVQDKSRKGVENGHLFHELKQFLVTMGILVVVYDVTIIPLIIDINMGAGDPSFMMPHVLNSFCFLNSFCNPLVYLIRIKKMRKEMKRFLRQCYGNVFCYVRCHSGDNDH